MQKNRFLELKMQANAGSIANKKATEAEFEKLTKKTITRKVENEKKNTETKEKDVWMNDPVETAEEKIKQRKKKAKRVASFGWEAFNEEALYNAYRKRIKRFERTKKEEEKNEKEKKTLSTTLLPAEETTNEENIDLMVKELKEQKEKREKFSRRRAHYEDEDVSYINDRNRHFNKKISRAFDKYTVEIRQDLERGTAL